MRCSKDTTLKSKGYGNPLSKKEAWPLSGPASFSLSILYNQCFSMYVVRAVFSVKYFFKAETKFFIESHFLLYQSLIFLSVKRLTLVGSIVKIYF